MPGDFTTVMAEKHRRNGHLDAPTRYVTLWVSFWVVIQEDMNKTGSSKSGRDGRMVYHGIMGRKERVHFGTPFVLLKEADILHEVSPIQSREKKRRTINEPFSPRCLRAPTIYH